MSHRGIITWIGGYLAGCLATGVSIGTIDRYHASTARAEVVITQIGDIGSGEPLPGEVIACQTVSGGEMIYPAEMKVWRCE